MIRFLASLNKRRIIRRYLKHLPRRLRQDYQYGGPYTPGQVEATVRRHRISALKYVEYAVAMFCDRDELKRLTPEYERIRREVGEHCFGGDTYFTFNDVTRAVNTYGDHGLVGGHSGEGATSHDGGGHH